MLSSAFANLQVVERERVDSKAEQENLNMKIQEFLKEMEVLCWALTILCSYKLALLSVEMWFVLILFLLRELTFLLSLDAES